MKPDESRRSDRRLPGNEPTPIVTHQHRLVVTERGDQKPHILDQRLAPIRHLLPVKLSEIAAPGDRR